MIKIDEKDQRVIALRREEKRLHDIVVRHSQKKKELDEMTARYIAARQTNNSNFSFEVDEILEGAEVGPKISRDEIDRLEHEINVLTAAIPKQQKAVDSARSEFSLALCEAERKRYVQIEKRIFRAVQELAAANEAEVRFFQELEDAGASSISFRPMRIQHVGLASDPQSVAAHHRKEFEEFVPEATV